MAKVGKIENRLTIQGVDNTAKAISSAQKGLKKVRDEAKGTQDELKKANKTTDDWLGKLTGGAFAYNEISDAAGRVTGSFGAVINTMGDAVTHAQMLTSAFGDIDTAYETAAETGYALSMDGLARGVNMLKAAHVPIELTAGQLEKISHLAESMGVDGNEGLTKFSEAIAKGETASLEALGIFIRSEDVIAEYAKQHNLAAGAIDTHTKKLIIAKAAIKEVNEAQLEVSGASDSWTEATNKLDVAWSKVKSKFISPVAEGVADVFNFFTGGAPKIAETDKAAIRLGETIKSHVASLESVNTLLQERIEKTRGAAKEEIKLRQAALQGDAPTYEGILLGVQSRIKAASDEFEKWAKSVKTSEDALKSASEKLEKNYSKPYTELDEKVKELIDQFIGLGASGQDVDEWSGKIYSSLGSASESIDGLMTSVGDSVYLTQENFKQFFSGTTEGWEHFQNQISLAGEDVALAGLDYKKFTEDITDENGNVIDSVDTYIIKLGDLKEAYDNVESYGQMGGGQSAVNSTKLLENVKMAANWFTRSGERITENTNAMGKLNKSADKLKQTQKDTEKSLKAAKKTREAANKNLQKALDRELHIRREIKKVIDLTLSSSLGVIGKMQSWLKRTDISIKGISRAKTLNMLTKARFEVEKTIAKVGIQRDRAALKSQVQILKARHRSLELTFKEAEVLAAKDPTGAMAKKVKGMWDGAQGKELRQVLVTMGRAFQALQNLDDFEKIIDASKFKRPRSGKGKGSRAAPSLPDAISDKFIKEQQLARLKAKAAMTNEDKKRAILLEFEIKALTHIAQKEKELLMLKKAGSKHAHLRADVQKRFAHQMMTAEVEKEQALQKLRAEGFKSIESGIAKMNAASKAQLDKLRAEAEAERQSRLEKMREFNDLMFGMSQDLNQRLAEAHGMTIEDADGKTQSVLDNTQKGVLKAAGAMQSVAVLTKKLINENGKLQDGMITALGSSLAAFFEHEHERSAFMAGMVMLDAIAATIRTQNYAYLALGAAAAAGYGALAGVQYSAHKKEEAAKARAESMKAASVKPIKAAGGEAMGGAITYVFNAPVIGGSAQELSAQMSGMQADGSGSGFAGGGI